MRGAARGRPPSAVPGLRDLADARDREPGGRERGRGAAGGAEREAERGEAPAERDGGRLVAVAHGEERGAGVGSGRPAARSALANAVGKSAALAITSPVERISGPEHRVGSGEAGEREDGGLDGDVRRRLTGGGASSASAAPAARRQAAATRLTPSAFETNGHRPRRARVRLEDVEAAVVERQLHVEEPDDAERGREPATVARTRRGRSRAADRREHAGGVARVDAGLLDVLHERRHPGLLPVAERVDVELDGALEEAVDEHASRPSAAPRRPPARSRPACACRRGRRTAGRAPGSRSPPRRRPRPSGSSAVPQAGTSMPRPPAEVGEALAVLGEVDGLVRRPEDRIALLLERARQLERRLAAELDDDALRLLARADLQHLLDPQRLEVEPVGRVVVGRDGLRVAVDHHGLVAERAERLDGVDAAVVELDALADPVRARAEDDDARLLLAGRASSSSPQVE